MLRSAISKSFLLLLTAVLIVFAGYKALQQDTFTLTIAHVNDTHAHLQPMTVKLRFDDTSVYADTGGFPRLVTKIESLRAGRDHMLFLHAGDVFQGTLYFNKYHGLADLLFLSMMQLDAMCLGNHEFDSGPGTLGQFIDKAGFPVLCANIDVSKEPTLAGKILPYVCVQADNETIGIIGLITPETATISMPGDTVIFTDPADAAQEAVDKLTANGVTKIIALTHLGFVKDVELAGEVAGIDIIVGGHSHTLLGDFEKFGLAPENAYPVTRTGPGGDPVLIVQSWEWAKVLGIVEVTFDREGIIKEYRVAPVLLVGQDFMEKDSQGTMIPVGTEQNAAIRGIIDTEPGIEVVEPDGTAQDALDAYAVSVKDMYNQTVAIASRDMLHVRFPGTAHSSGMVLAEGSQVVPVVADAMMWKARQVGLDPKIAIVNGGAVRGDILQGTISLGHIYDLMPFGNTLFVLEITGDQVASALEHAVCRAYTDADSDGAFPYVSGMRYAADLSLPEGEQLVSLETDNGSGIYAPLEEAATCRVVTNSYLAAGGDAYDMPADAQAYRYDTGFVIADVFAAYAALLETLHPPEEGRITIYGHK